MKTTVYFNELYFRTISIDANDYVVIDFWRVARNLMRRFHGFRCETTITTSNGSWRQGIKGEMTCTVYVALVWNIIYWIMMIITLFTE